MQKTLTFLILFIVISFFSCGDTYSPSVSLQVDESRTLCTNCQSPNLFKLGASKLLITYIKSEKNGEDALMLRTLEDGHLTDPLTIAKGDNWFVNWADVPSIVSLDKSGENLMAHWLQMSADGTYDYDIRCAISKDRGISWGDSFVLHDDGVSAEHGFVTMTAASKGAFVTWLDGRNTKTAIDNQKAEAPENHDHGHGHGSNENMPMTLRAAWIDQNGKKTKDLEIDNKVCDCCQTDAVYTSSGPVVAYRDRSDDEIRDISIARYIDNKWTHKTIHNDNWEIAGCPVNGPAIAYEDGLLAVTWYTHMNNIPKIFLAISRDDGNSFEDPILISEEEVMGRIDVAMDHNKDVIVTWMANEGEKTFICGNIYSTIAYQLSDTYHLIETSGERRSGFPIIEHFNERLVMVRTKVDHEETSVILETIDGS